MTPLIISADDYAQSAAIDDGIIDLIGQERLTATSCLTLSPRWPDAAKLLNNDVQSLADIGLHLDFTQFAQTRYPLAMLIARAVTRSLSAKAIKRSINSQLDRFEDALGKAPDYIDGHQHVHQLPKIRDALVEIISRRYVGKLPWLRIANPPVQDGFKGWVIRNLGAENLRTNAKMAGVRCSESLLGVYDFSGNTASYMQKLGSWVTLAKSGDGVCALMCHPAKVSNSNTGKVTDPISQARLREFEVFSSAGFLDLLKLHHIYPARGNAISN